MQQWTKENRADNISPENQFAVCFIFEDKSSNVYLSDCLIVMAPAHVSAQFDRLWDVPGKMVRY